VPNKKRSYTVFSEFSDSSEKSKKNPDVETPGLILTIKNQKYESLNVYTDNPEAFTLDTSTKFFPLGLLIIL
jgi:hypothetical protein